MWKDMLCGLALANIESLECYRIGGRDNRVGEEICRYVRMAVVGLPWYYRLPFKILATALGLLCLVTTRHSLCSLAAEDRSHFLRRIRIVPFFSMLNKFVRATAFLNLFDNPSMATTIPTNFVRKSDD